MYFFVMVFAAVYWIIYGNWIGGCLMASLFLVLIYSIRRCKREKKQLEFKMNVKDWVIKEGEVLQIVPAISGIVSWNNDYIFEIEYEIEAKFREKKKQIKQKLRWNQNLGEITFSTEELKECDRYILHLKSVAWEDLTGLYKVKKKCDQKIRFLVMPISYDLEEMNQKLQKQQLCEQGFEYAGVRAYQEGDKISRIHCNLYASTRQLWVRKNEDESEDYVKIGLDLTDVSKDDFSDYFSVFYSVSRFYMNAGFYQEIYYGTHCFLLKDIEQYEELFTDIFNEGIQELPEGISGIQKIKLDDSEQDVQKYLYDMEL